MGLAALNRKKRVIIYFTIFNILIIMGILPGQEATDTSKIFRPGSYIAKTYFDDDVVVKASRIPAGIMEIPASVSIINIKSKQEDHPQSWESFLGRLPGFRAYTTGNVWGKSNVSMRGFYGGGNADYMLVLYDGVPVNSLSSGMVEWSKMQIANIDRAEIIRGSVGAQYGDAGFGGIIVLTSPTAFTEDKIYVSSDYGSDNAYALNAGLSINDDQQAIKANICRKSNDGWREHSRYKSSNIQVKYERFHTSKLYLSVTASLCFTDEQDPGALSSEELIINRNMETADVLGNPWQSSNNSKDLLASLSGKYIYSRNCTFDFRAYMKHKNRKNIATITAPVKEDVNAYTYGIDLSLKKKMRILRRLLSINIGTAMEYGRLNSHYAEHQDLIDDLDDISDNSSSRINVAAFSQINYVLSDNISVQGGLRYDYFNTRCKYNLYTSMNNEVDHYRRDSEISPKLGLTIMPIKDLSVYFSVSRAFKFPTLLHLYESVPIYYFEPPDYSAYFSISNANLMPQRGTCYETGLKFNNPELGKISIAYYYYKIWDEIDFDNATFKYMNIGRSEHTGMEIALEREFNSGLTVGLIYELISARFKSGIYKNNHINGVPLYKYGFNIKYNYGRGYLALNGMGRGNQFIDQANLNRLSRYFVLNTNLGLKLKIFKVDFVVYNIFNRIYNHDGYIGITGENRCYPAQGRRFMIRISRGL
jgi:outer membrane receptor protein involved in Fe transport